MREIRSRRYYCPKRGVTVTLVEYAIEVSGREGVCGILSCSHQGLCPSEKTKEGEPVFPWATCPACTPARRAGPDQEENSSR
ncbi:MAG: hypothetical protein JRH06_02480 [Deltaproteobacteria bacterium]|nr:hypothetical protein [Deltaproteobacteria bacterium]MBW2136406.1 hypothetical protein [Deltaproteobacteria bacterium]